MREAFIKIADVPTHIFTWGHWIEESFSKKEVVLCITGNPGLSGYYTKFMATIHETLDRNIPVWVIGHAGHDEPKNSSGKVPPLKNNEHLYSMDAQVQHKAEFIRKYVPKDVKIHLIGHSIGSWMVLELLKIPDISSRIHHCYLLFPTIERMAESPSGWLYTKLLKPPFPLLYCGAVLLSLLPTIVTVLILYIVFYMWSIPRLNIGTTLKYIRPSILQQIIFLADEEMVRVREADYEHIERNVKRLKFYYGATDGWTPTDYCKQLIERIPEVDAQIDVNQFSHSFVLRSSVEMGKLVSGWILENSTK